MRTKALAFSAKRKKTEKNSPKNGEMPYIGAFSRKKTGEKANFFGKMC